MKFLIINNDYSGFLQGMYAATPGLSEANYDRQMQARNDTMFGVADFYSRALKGLGHEAIEVHENNETMQATWAAEHGVAVNRQPWKFRLRKGVVPWFGRVNDRGWLLDVLVEQVKAFKPDVVLNQAMDSLPNAVLSRIKPHAKLLVGQIAAPITQENDLQAFDLVLSSLPNMLEFYAGKGIKTEYQQLAFEPRVLQRLPAGERTTAVSFVGSITPHHRARFEWLEWLCEKTEITVWGAGAEALPANSPIRRRHRGPVWGLDMYRALLDSKMTLNYHIGISGPYANNMRLYEATGAGTCLITDWKQNLHTIFEPGREVLAYKDREECLALINSCLADNGKRQAVAVAGQARTLRDHTYPLRAAELVDIVGRYL